MLKCKHLLKKCFWIERIKTKIKLVHSCLAVIEHRSWPNVFFHIVHYPAEPAGRRLAQLTSSDWSVLSQCWSSVLLVNFVEPTKNNITFDRCINLMLVQLGFVHRLLLSPITLSKLTKHCSGQCPTFGKHQSHVEPVF